MFFFKAFTEVKFQVEIGKVHVELLLVYLGGGWFQIFLFLPPQKREVIQFD